MVHTLHSDIQNMLLGNVHLYSLPIFAIVLIVRICLVTLPGLSAQYPAVFSAAPATKLMEEGKMHPVEHLINPLALQHDPTAASAGSTPPPFQVLTCT